MRAVWVLALVMAVSMPVLGQPARTRSAKGRASSGKARPGVVHPSRIALPENPTDDEDDLDGSKLFTADTETLPKGDWSLNLAYFLSQAKSTFDDTGDLSDLGGTRRSEIFVLSASAGLSEDADLTLVATGNRVNDRFTLASSDQADSPGLGPVQGAALTNLALQARWRLVADEGDGFSLALIGGPALQELLQLDDEDTLYTIRGSFASWQQSLVLRKDFDRFSANLELFYGFPFASGTQTFQQYGANLGLGYNANSWLLPVVELNYTKALPFQDSSVESLAGTLGVIIKPGPTAAFSLGVQKTLWGRNIESFTTYCATGSINF